MTGETRNGVVVLLLGALGLGSWSAGPGEAAASSLQDLEARVMALEDKLAMSEEIVAQQQELLGARVEAGPSAIDDFLGGLEFGGHVTASYVYNFNNPDVNMGAQPYFQFNTDHNNFALDAAKIAIGKPASEPGTAGFQLDLLWGENANILAAATPTETGRFFNDSTTSNRAPGDADVFVQQAYVSYNARGVELKFGKFETLLGYELIDSPYNPHVSHGLLFTYAIPLYHTGLLASGGLGGGIDWAFGVVDGFNNANDFGDNKGLIGRVGYEFEDMAVALNAFIGAEQTRTSRTAGGAVVGDNHDRRQIYDLVWTYSAREDLDLWLNADYGFEEFSRDPAGGVPSTNDDGQWWGVAAGFIYNLTEKASLAVRGEWFRDDGGTRLLGLPAAGVPPFSALAERIDMTSATVTLRYQLTNNLMTRLEYRHDTFDGVGPEDALGVDFPKSDADWDDQQNVGIFEVSYVFD